MANYISDITDSLRSKMGDQDSELLRFYALLVLTTGTDTTLENVHDAWSAWRDATKPDHKSLVKFDQLTTEVQQLDEKYAAAIREVSQGTVLGETVVYVVCANVEYDSYHKVVLATLNEKEAGNAVRERNARHDPDCDTTRETWSDFDQCFCERYHAHELPLSGLPGLSLAADLTSAAEYAKL